MENRQATLQDGLCIFYDGLMRESSSEATTAEPGGEPSAEQVATQLASVVSRLLRRLRTTSSDSLLTPTQRSVLSASAGRARPPRPRWPAPSTYGPSPCG